MVKPSGWYTVKYNDIIDGNYLYNRCHLIGFQLAGENANPKNLITGTRYLNVVGMLSFENAVDDYVDTTGNHVLYRVTPMFSGDELSCQRCLNANTTTDTVKMPSERKEKSTTPLARDDFSNNEFNTIINTGLHQAKNNESRPVKDVFSDLRKRI